VFPATAHKHVDFIIDRIAVYGMIDERNNTRLPKGRLMNPREQRGVIIAALCKLVSKDGQWVVPSQTASDKRYVVNAQAGTCTCPDHVETGFKCKHVYAVEFTMKRELAVDGTVTETRTLTFSEKKTYKQNWPVYNDAQATEKHRFQVLLSDLCRGVPEPVRMGTGRKPHLVRDQLFSVCFKVYSTLSHRRFGCDLADAHAAGYLTRSLHYNKVPCFFEDPALTPHLLALIGQSSAPLAAVETDFAVDSSGFSTSKFVRWYDEKYGVERSGHDWVKVHLACGVKTHIVTAAAIYERDTADCPILPELVKGTAQRFTIREVSGDKAYLSAENVETVAHYGGQAFIAPKVNTTGGIGGLFEKMFLYYRYKQEEFMNHYHKRSNVESVFSMIKRKFGDSVRARTPAAMVNESLAKLVCHNLTCVIMSQAELGIEAEFWKQPVGVQVIAV
jgi:transposase